MQTARLKGRQIGRPKLELDTARIMEMHAAGMGVVRIATALGSAKYRETVRRIIAAQAKPT